jgi:c-di-GMP-binding flagellar brake protein YcgR
MSKTNNGFVEQRKFLRLSADDIGLLTCTIPVSPQQTIILESTDISPGGFGAIVPDDFVQNFHLRDEFTHCQINLPSMEDVSIRLVGLWRPKGNDDKSGMFAGFEFISAIDWLSTALDSCVMPD